MERIMELVRQYVRDTIAMHEREIRRARVNIDWCKSFLAEIEQQQRKDAA